MNLVNCEIYLKSGQTVTIELEEEHANNVIANLMRSKQGQLVTPNEEPAGVTYIFNNVVGLRILPEVK
jgi:hypothetical protein